jgi:hypothetical protein
MKSETRNPKSERSPKSEARKGVPGFHAGPNKSVYQNDVPDGATTKYTKYTKIKQRKRNAIGNTFRVFRVFRGWQIIVASSLLDAHFVKRSKAKALDLIFEGKPKFEAPGNRQKWANSDFGFRASFGIRNSEFGFPSPFALHTSHFQ